MDSKILLYIYVLKDRRSSECPKVQQLYAVEH